MGLSRRPGEAGVLVLRTLGSGSREQPGLSGPQTVDGAAFKCSLWASCSLCRVAWPGVLWVSPQPLPPGLGALRPLTSDGKADRAKQM